MGTVKVHLKQIELKHRGKQPASLYCQQLASTIDLHDGDGQIIAQPLLPLPGCCREQALQSTMTALELCNRQVLESGQIGLWKERPEELLFLEPRLPGAFGQSKHQDGGVRDSIRDPESFEGFPALLPFKARLDSGGTKASLAFMRRHGHQEIDLQALSSGHETRVLEEDLAVVSHPGEPVCWLERRHLPEGPES